MYETTYPMNFTDEDLKTGRVDSNGTMTFKTPIVFNAKISKSGLSDPTIELVGCTVDDVVSAGMEACLNVELPVLVYGYDNVYFKDPAYKDSGTDGEILSFDKLILDSGSNHLHFNIVFDTYGDGSVTLSVVTLDEQ